MRKIDPSSVGVSVLVIAALVTIPMCMAQQDRENRRQEADRARPAPVSLEFVCYEDDKLTERHVGVEEAEEKVSGPAWRITYVEGGYAIYAQRPGESCQVETSQEAGG